MQTLGQQPESKGHEQEAGRSGRVGCRAGFWKGAPIVPGRTGRYTETHFVERARVCSQVTFFLPHLFGDRRFKQLSYIKWIDVS